MEINTTILREISFQLTQGNPWWGMLLANEYVDRTSPLRPALILKFQHKLGSALTGRESLALALICGRKKESLSYGELTEIGSRVVSRFKSVGSIQVATPQNNLPLPNSNEYSARSIKRISARLAVRQRSNPTARFNSASLPSLTDRPRLKSIATRS
jgi:hypothetical protein